jgi:hypothetical protein
LGISQNKLSRVENGKFQPDGELLVRIKMFIADDDEQPVESHPILSVAPVAEAETPVEAATSLHSEFLALIDAQGDGSNRLDIAAERMQEALWWFESHFCERRPT